MTHPDPEVARTQARASLQNLAETGRLPEREGRAFLAGWCDGYLRYLAATQVNTAQWAAWFRETAAQADDLTEGQREGLRIAAEHLDNPRVQALAARIPLEEQP